MNSHRVSAVALALAAFLPAAEHASAQAAGGFPDKPLRMLVGNAPGGGSDITARAVADKLGERLGQPVIVDNRPGASGIIAMNAVAQAPANGYTLLISSGGELGSIQVQKKLGYDVRTGFAPVTQLTSQYYLLLSSPSIPATSLKELIEYARSRPGVLSFGSAGMGSTGHAGLELMKSMTGTDIVHVPYKGIAPALTDMIGAQLHLAFVSTISGGPQVSSGKLRALAVTSAQRAKSYPNLPALAELAPGFELTSWYGLFATGGTPAAVVDALFRNTTLALQSPELQTRFAGSGAEAAPSASVPAFVQALASELARWEKVSQMPGFAEALK